MKRTMLLIAVILSGLTVMAQNSVTLKMNPEKNKVYLLKSVSEQTVSQTVNGNLQNVESEVEYTMSLKMIDMTPDLLVAEIRFDTLVTKTNTMGKLAIFSSTAEGDIKSSEAADIMSYIMNRLSKAALFVKMDFTGKPLEIINSKMVSDLVLKDTGSITLTGPVSAALKTQIASTVSDENLKTMIGTFTWCLPARQVSVGEEWNVTQEMNAGGMNLDIISTYHLDAIDGNFAKITSTSQIKASDNAAPIHSGGATVSYGNLKGLGKSNMVIDINAGLVAEDNVKTRISGNLDVSAPGFSMQIPLDINGESKVRALK
ncbi:MAG: DUF6263 family protein [Bacteroidales bacterium]